MSIRVTADELQPSATIEIPLSKPLPDYDLEQMEQPTPRDVDSVLVSQGFRDLVDDARGVLTELLQVKPLELVQLTGAICPGEDEVYRPGLWIVLSDSKAQSKSALPAETQERIRGIAAELVKRLHLDE
jgi:hypothetical protein